MVSRSRFPLFELGLVIVSATVGVVVASIEASVYFHPAYRPPLLWVCAAWVLWRGLVLDRCLTRRQAWHVTPLWEIDAATVAHDPQVNPLLGRGFRWTERHTQALEDEIRTVGALPVGPEPRGGTAALHAVGEDEEADICIPWTEFVGQGGLRGTNRSGKTQLLKLLIVQAIAHE